MTRRAPRDPQVRKRAAELAQHADSLSSRLLDITTPIYSLDERRLPQAIGSAVLLQIGEARFLVTAAHVLDRRHELQLLVPTGAALTRLGGDVLRFYSPTAETVADDHVDVGVVRLEGDVWQHAHSSRFAQWDELDHSDLTVTRDAFAALGYPFTKQRNTVKGRTIQARAYRMAAMESPRAVYEAERRDPQVSLLLGFDRRQVWSSKGKVTAPDLYGMSGCGVWRFGARMGDVTAPPRLSGVVIEWHRTGRHKYILATRIWPILEAMGQQYADLQGLLGKLAGGAV